MKLEGRVALISGASKNNGGTIAAFMAREGAKVACNDIIPEVAQRTADHIRAFGGEAIAVPGDVSSEDQVQAIVRTTVEAFGHVDTLVNLAGRQFRGDILSVDLDEWNQQLAGFLTGTMLMTREVARDMVARGRKGCLITVLSSAAHQGQPGAVAYCTVKSGLINFTRAAAMDLAHYGVRVNSISPTTMEHNLDRMVESRRSGAQPTGLSGRTPDRATITSQDMLRGIPMGRFCRASDLAKAAVFLASDDAEFITGHDLRVDGGVTARYWPWIPGAHDDVTIDDYLENQYKPMAWGEETES